MGSRCGILFLVVAALVAACQPVYDHIGGRFQATAPADFPARASPLARELVGLALKDMPPGGRADHHVHLAGLGRGTITTLCDGIGESGIALHPSYSTWASPVRRFKRGVMMSASGVRDDEHADLQYLERLLELARHAGPARYFLYAMDWRHFDDGTIDHAGSHVHVPDDYVIKVSRCLNAKPASVRGEAEFIPVASIHPRRRDAIDALRRVADAGVRYIKWLPPAQNIKPNHRDLIPFYDEMHRLGVVLLSHTGLEHTFRPEIKAEQDWANPSRLELPLSRGVTVVMLHSGRDGEEPKPGADGRKASYFDRFVEMMEKHPTGLYGELGAVPYLKTEGILTRMLSKPRIRCRIVDGSDYPNPAIAIINPTDRLLEQGWLRWPGEPDDTMARQRKEALDEIYRYNPFLFDFTLKRTLRIDGRPIPAAAFFDIPTKTADPERGCGQDIQGFPVRST